MSVTFTAQNQAGFLADSPELNLANGNARDFSHALGLDLGDDLAGSADPELVIRACRKLVLRPAGSESVEVPDVVDGRMIWCGRPAGYMEQRAEQLLKVAVFAKENGGTVCWS